MLTVICPRCNGAKSAFGVMCSDRGCQTGSWVCDFCKGEGQVSSETAERWRKGRAMRDARVKLGVSQREEANRLGISLIVVCVKFSKKILGMWAQVKPRTRSGALSESSAERPAAD